MEWTENELEILKKKYPEKGSDIEELKQKRSRGAIRSKAKRIGIKTENKSVHPEKVGKNNYTTGYLVGSIIGDGSVKSGEYRISFTQKDEDYINKLRRCFKKLNSKKPSKYNRKSSYYEISYSSKKWVKEFKRIIEEVLNDKENKDKEFKKGYISGLFDSEGSVVENNKSLALKLTMTSLKPVSKYCEYLNYLNVNVFVKQGKASYNKEKKTYRCSIGKHYEIKKFEEQISLGIERKQDKISKYIKNKAKKNTTWSDKEIKRLKNNYAEKGTDIDLERPDGSIRAKASELNIRKTR